MSCLLREVICRGSRIWVRVRRGIMVAMWVVEVGLEEVDP